MFLIGASGGTFAPGFYHAHPRLGQVGDMAPAALPGGIERNAQPVGPGRRVGPSGPLRQKSQRLRHQQVAALGALENRVGCLVAAGGRRLGRHEIALQLTAGQ